ncbi:MAG: hypothetical protein AAF580_06985 [Pseudomonadota bacterium]
MVDADIAQQRLADLDAKRQGRGKLGERKFRFSIVVGAVLGALIAYVVGDTAVGLEGVRLWALTALGLVAGAVFWLLAIGAGLFLAAVEVLG